MPGLALEQAVAQFWLASRAVEEPEGEGAEIKAGTAGDDWQAVAGGDLVQGGSGLAAVFAGGEELVGVDDVDEVVGDLLLLFGVGLAEPMSRPR